MPPREEETQTLGVQATGPEPTFSYERRTWEATGILPPGPGRLHSPAWVGFIIPRKDRNQTEQGWGGGQSQQPEFCRR